MNSLSDEEIQRIRMMVRCRYRPLLWEGKIDMKSYYKKVLDETTSEYKKAMRKHGSKADSE
jgi:hypothetical protein